MQKTIHDEQYKILIKWLKESREKQSLTMRELANKMDIPHSIIWNIENCERRLDVMEYIDYCNQLRVNPVTGIEMITQKEKSVNKL